MIHGHRIPLILLALGLAALVAGLHVQEKVDLNQATRNELEAIPGIGPSLAGKIILERNRRGGFRTLEDLLKIRGIGRKTLNHLEKYITIDDSAQPKRQE